MSKPDAAEFISQAYRHYKAIAFEEDVRPMINKTVIGEDLKKNKNLPGVVMNSSAFIKAIKQHRFWEREKSPV